MPKSQDIRELAFTMWQQAGSPPGGAENFLKAAEETLGAPGPITHEDVDEAIDESFPASDATNRM